MLSPKWWQIDWYLSRANRQFEQDPIDPIQPTEATMNAIYTAVLVASTLAYTAVAWIGLSIDTANEDLL